MRRTCGRDPVYELRADESLKALHPLDQGAEIAVRGSHEPDLTVLGGASVFVGSKIDTARVSRAASKLKLVHATSAGVEAYLPLDWLPPGAILTNSGGIHAAKAG